MRRSVWSLLFSFVVGCGGGSGSQADDDRGTDDDTSLPADDDDAPSVTFGIDWQLSAVIPTVVSVAWTVDAEHVEDAWVEFGPGGTYSFRAPALDDGEGGFESFLLGLKPLSEASFRAGVSVDGQIVRSDTVFFVTGSIPLDVPTPTLDALVPNRATGGFMVTSLLSSPSYAVILDGDGDIVWWHTPDSLADLAFVPVVLLSQDGRSLLYLSRAVVEEGDDIKRTFLIRVALDGSEEEQLEMDAAHHGLVELADGTLAVLEVDNREVDGEMVEGDRIVELRPDGSKSVVFSVWDHLAYEPLELPDSADGWTHANALDVSDDEGTYYVSLKHLDAIVEVDRASGDLLLQIGGEDSDVALADGGKHLFEWQHQFEVLSSGILVFDNGPHLGPESRAVEYAIDPEGGSAEFVWEHISEPPLYVYTLGDVARLPSGNTLVVWSTSGMMEEVTPEGEIVQRLAMPMGVGFGYVRWTETLYYGD